MKITKKVMGYVSTNSYLLEKDGKGIWIDPCLNPGSNAQPLLEASKDIDIVGILLTHGHFDHISAVDTLVKHFACPVYIHEKEIPYLKDPHLNLSAQTPETLIVESEVIGLSEGHYTIEPFTFQVYHTPGHTPFSVSYLFDDKHLFDGDFIFAGSIGRVDFVGGSAEEMCEGVRRLYQIFEQNLEETIVYPGHGLNTTLIREKINNPYVIQFLEES